MVTELLKVVMPPLCVFERDKIDSNCNIYYNNQIIK